MGQGSGHFRRRFIRYELWNQNGCNERDYGLGSGALGREQDLENKNNRHHRFSGTVFSYSGIPGVRFRRRGYPDRRNGHRAERRREGSSCTYVRARKLRKQRDGWAGCGEFGGNLLFCGWLNTDQYVGNSLRGAGAVDDQYFSEGCSLLC